MQPYQQRVVEERKELIERIEKLRAFVTDPVKWIPLSKDERMRLCRQLHLMNQLRDVLNERIQAFNS